jgi:adenosine deaminase
VPDPPSLAERFHYRDFAHFIEMWLWKNGFIREYEDFRLIGEAVARDLAGQNVRYVEAFFSAPDFVRIGLATAPIAEALRAGLSRVPEVEVALIADVVRDFGPERALRVVDEAADLRDLGVIGIGLGGSEQMFPPEPFAPVFERARHHGLRTTAHAGEVAGAAGVWEALEHLRPERIGHGVGAREDARLMDHLAASGIPLECCPISNLRTGAVASIAEHPIRQFVDRGMVVTVNTDDPAMFGTSLSEEYRLLVDALGFSRGDIRRLLLDAVEASWTSVERKAELAAEIRRAR